MGRVKYNKLKGYFVENGISNKEIATVLGCTPNTVSKKLNRNAADLTMRDFQLLTHKYKINGDLFKLY